MRTLTSLVIATATILGLSAGGASAQAQKADTGKQVYDQWCATCHAAGPRNPGTAALAAKYNGKKPAALEMRTDLTPALVKFYVRNGVSVMPSFRKTEITDAELNALGAYLATSAKKNGKR